MKKGGEAISKTAVGNLRWGIWGWGWSSEGDNGRDVGSTCRLNRDQQSQIMLSLSTTS